MVSGWQGANRPSRPRRDGTFAVAPAIILIARVDARLITYGMIRAAGARARAKKVAPAGPRSAGAHRPRSMG
jgi:hypothetical protein